MGTSRTDVSLTDLAAEVGGLGILALPLFPLTLPGLLLVDVPLALFAAICTLITLPLVLPIWLARPSSGHEDRLPDRPARLERPVCGRGVREREALREREMRPDATRLQRPSLELALALGGGSLERPGDG